VINGIGAFGGLIEVLSGCNFAAVHYCKMLLFLIFQWEECQVFFVVFFDGVGDGGVVGVERGQFL